MIAGPTVTITVAVAEVHATAYSSYHYWMFQ